MQGDQNGFSASSMVNGRSRGVSGMVVCTLETLIRETHLIMALQAEMASTIAGHIRELGATSDAPEHLHRHLDAVVTATQAEDHLRQRHEQLIAMLRVVAEAYEKPAKTGNGPSAVNRTVTPAAKSLKRRIMEAATFADTRTALRHACGSRPVRAELDGQNVRADTTDIELF